MHRKMVILTCLLVMGILAAACGPVTPVAGPAKPVENAVTPVPAETSAPAPAAEQSGGPKIITGQVAYTNSFFTMGVAEPVIILEDQGGFVTRDRKFVIPVESQVIGQITSDFYKSPFTYSLTLPAVPNGTLHDVNHDGKQDTGVMVFAVAYWTNTWGDPYLERRDQGGGGWSSAYASTRVSDSRDSYLEVFGGKYLVYAPDASQQFPSGFGDDKKLFTDDDPITNLPAGWSLIDLDQTPFGMDRSENPVVDLLEPEGSALDDFSSLSYVDAFDKMLDKFKREYAFTDFKKIDWDAKAAEFRPRFESAQKSKDKHAYALALRDFIWSIPDTHVGFDQTAVRGDFTAETAGGLGFAMRETDDGQIVANFILPGGPAEQAGMVWGAEILSLDGKSAAEAVDAAVPWSSPFSNPTNKRYQQLRYALRFKLDKGQVEVTFKNPGASEQTASLPVVAERESFASSSIYAGAADTALPVEFKVLPSGYGYIKISSFSDNDVLSIQVWERAIRYFKENQVPGVILDLRLNGGGSGWLADQMAAYFFGQETVVGNTAFYNKGSGQFYMDPGDETRMLPPQADLQYDGPVVVMVGPGCASACEFFSYNMTINGRATVVGQYPSEGAGGSVEQFLMPESTTVQLTIGRAVDAQGEIHLEGKGVVPTVKVPVNLEILKRQFDGEDVVLTYAEKVVSQPQGAGITPAAAPKLASAGEAEAALTGGEKFLEDKAREKYETADYSKPGTLTFTVPLVKSQNLIWAYAWCAKDVTTLKQNFEHIQLAFQLDGVDVSSQMTNYETESNGQQCRLVYTALSEWLGGEHHLTTTATFDARINDGMADYEPGDYIMEYGVFVKP